MSSTCENKLTVSSIEFEESVRVWYESHNGPTSMSSFTKVVRVLTMMADAFKLKEFVDTKEPVLVHHLINYVNENQKMASVTFSNVVEEIRNSSKSRNSAGSYVSCGRKALVFMGLTKETLKPLPLTREKQYESEDTNEPHTKMFVPTAIRSIPDGCSTKMFFMRRLDSMHNHSATIRSEVSIKNMSRYWVRALTQFGDLETLNFEDVDFWSVSNVIKTISPTSTPHEIIDLYHLFSDFNDEWKSVTLKQFKTRFALEKCKEISKAKISSGVFGGDGADDRDRHRLSSKQQEDIMAACVTPFERLFVSLLFSTGLRVSGLRNIKLSDVVADPCSDSITVLEFGRTLEKRGKTRTFPIVDMVKKPMVEWIEQNRGLQSPYLFPSPRVSNTPLTVQMFQSTFKAIAKRAGHEGPEVHVHAARHSVAFNLLEAGNTMDQIGKFLGHANPATTAKFYAKMSTRETVARMNTACIGGENRMATHKPDIPDFGRKQREEDENARRRRKKRNYLSALKDIKITIQ